MAAPSLLVCPCLEKIINLLLLVFQADPFLSLYSLLSRDYGLELRCKDFSAISDSMCAPDLCKGFWYELDHQILFMPHQEAREGKEIYSTRWWIYHSACCNCLYCGVHNIMPLWWWTQPLAFCAPTLSIKLPCTDGQMRRWCPLNNSSKSHYFCQNLNTPNN